MTVHRVLVCGTTYADTLSPTPSHNHDKNGLRDLVGELEGGAGWCRIGCLPRSLVIISNVASVANGGQPASLACDFGEPDDRVSRLLFLRKKRIIRICVLHKSGRSFRSECLARLCRCVVRAHSFVSMSFVLPPAAALHNPSGVARCVALCLSSCGCKYDAHNQNHGKAGRAGRTKVHAVVEGFVCDLFTQPAACISSI